MQTRPAAASVRKAARVLLPLLMTASLASAQTPQPETQAANTLKLRKLHPDFYVIGGPENGETPNPNLIVYVTGNGVVLVDPWFGRDYDHVVAAVKSVTDEPIRYVINTHFHSDHTGANPHFPASVEIVAQANTRRHMLEHTMPGAPTNTFTDEETLYLGGKEIRLRYLGPGHTDGDLAVYFPEWKTVCLGDMMAGTNGITNPVVDYANGGTLKAWPASLDRALAFDVETVIPGHGPIVERDGLVAHRDKIATIGKSLAEWDAEGKTTEQIHDLLISTYSFKPINLRAVDGLVAEYKKP